MPKMHINRTITIDQPIEKVFQSLSNMGEWPQWSPWLIMEPDAKVNVKEGNKYYEWEGHRVGSGNMSISKQIENKSIDYDLTFLKPWKSHAKVGMMIKPVPQGTEVKWTMDSSLPFFMFWMKKSMEAYIGSDYERGLMLLKDYLEKGKVESQLALEGVKEFPAIQYIGIKREADLDNAPQMMEEDFTKLMQYAHDHLDNCNPDHAFTQYHKWDMVNRRAQWTAALPVKDVTKVNLEGTISGQLPATKVQQIKHTGPYHHIGNAWSLAAMMMRNKEFKIKKGVSPIETYGNSPRNTPPEDLISYINFPVKV